MKNNNGEIEGSGISHLIFLNTSVTPVNLMILSNLNLILFKCRTGGHLASPSIYFNNGRYYVIHHVKSESNYIC